MSETAVLVLQHRRDRLDQSRRRVVHGEARASAVVDTAGLSVEDAATRLIEAVTPVLENENRSFGARSAAL